MNAKRIATLCAAAAAMVSMNAGSAQAQGLFGGYNQSYPVYTQPATTVWPSNVTNAGYAQPCTTGNCGVRGYTTNYGAPYTTGYPTATCPTGNCPPGQCSTICGPNGCQTICPTGYNASSPCGPNGCPPAGQFNSNYGASYGAPMTSNLPTLSLDQAGGWNGNAGYSSTVPLNMNGGFQNQFQGQAGFGNIAPARSNGPVFSGASSPMNGGFVPASFQTNITNDPMVRLN